MKPLLNLSQRRALRVLSRKDPRLAVGLILGLEISGDLLSRDLTLRKDALDRFKTSMAMARSKRAQDLPFGVGAALGVIGGVSRYSYTRPPHPNRSLADAYRRVIAFIARDVGDAKAIRARAALEDFWTAKTPTVHAADNPRDIESNLFLWCFTLLRGPLFPHRRVLTLQILRTSLGGLDGYSATAEGVRHRYKRGFESLKKELRKV